MKIYNVKCPSCGNTAQIRNKDGHTQWQGDISMIDIEGHAVPVCNCGCLMDGEKK